MSLPEILSIANVTQPTDWIGTENDTSVNKEELVAEMGAAFVGGACNIAPQTIENSAAYIQGWLKKLCSGKKYLVLAAAKAQKACCRIRSFSKSLYRIFTTMRFEKI